MKKIAIFLALLLLLTGCSPQQAQTPPEPETVEVTENVAVDVPAPESSEPELVETEAPTESLKPVKLTQQELAPFIELFHPEDDESPVVFANCFLVPEYRSPEEINLFDVFLNGINKESQNISKTERKKLKALDVIMELDICRTKREDMDAMLKLYTGYGLDEIQGVGLDAFVYLEDYDAYYIATGGTNWGFHDMLDGYWMPDGTVKLRYESDLGIQMAVTLRPAEGESPFGYWFVSNLPA